MWHRAKEDFDQAVVKDSIAEAEVGNPWTDAV